MEKLIRGIIDFRKQLSEESLALFAKLALQQKPDALFIACSDSRVVPNLFASTNPGDLFVLRNIGNLIPPYTGAPIDQGTLAVVEFALFSLDVKEIIVCGHSECGAIQAIFHDQHPESDEQQPVRYCCETDLKSARSLACSHLQSWLQYGASSIDEAGGELIVDPELSPHNMLSQVNVLKQMSHLATYPFIQQRLQNKSLHIHGWWFDIARADVYCYERAFRQFLLIDEEEAERLLKTLSPSTPIP